MRNLFGHLCSDMVFAHDKEMEMLASDRVHTKNENDSTEAQVVSNLRSDSVGSQPPQGGDVGHVDINQAPSNPALHNHEPEQTYRSSKRRRTIATGANVIVDAVDLDQQQLPVIKDSFQDRVNRLKTDSDAATVNSRVQAKSIELSNVSSTSSDYGASERLLDETPQPASGSRKTQCSQLASETQISLPDAAFESPSPRQPIAENGRAEVHRRKEAYSAAKDVSGTWIRDSRLISSADRQLEEELEL